MATSSVEEELICALCLEIYSDPRLLPCYHTFCKTCIEQLINKGEEKGKFNCPLCRSAITSTEFPSNIYIQTRLTFNNKEIIKCDLCESDENITVKCIDCDQLLCISCSAVHQKIKLCKDHKVIQYTQTDTESPSFKIKKNSFCKNTQRNIYVSIAYSARCVKKVKEECAKTWSEINKLTDNQASLIKEKKVEIDALISKMTSKKRYIDSVVSSGTDSDIMFCIKQLSKGPEMCTPNELIITIPTFLADTPNIKVGQTVGKRISLTLEPKVKFKHTFHVNMMNKSVSSICLRNKDEALISLRSDAWNQGSRVKNVLIYDSSGMEKELYFMPPQMDLIIDKNGRIYFYEDRLEKLEGGLIVYLKPDEENKTENIYPCKRPISMDILSNGDIIILDIDKKLSRINFDKKRRFVLSTKVTLHRRFL
ncbi:unnamed protein product [Mytilus edulis]|uniref:TRIM56 n=1 Tax=Mytilus edulis TaxID=6550 RepID=A0A8S3R116_MYTED|nr:unnamed protein product [Mytilus edulis]